MSDPKHPRLIAGPETAAVRKPEWRLGREDPSHPRLIAGGARRMQLAAWSLIQSGKKQTVGGIERAGERKVFRTSARRQALLRAASFVARPCFATIR